MRITSPITALCTAASVAFLFLLAPGPLAAAPVDGARIQAADREPGNWMSHGRSYDEQRYSPLAKIDQANVGQLGLAWTYKLDVDRGVEATPIVVDGVMFTTGAYSIVYALDARSGKLLWKYDPKVPREWAGNGCCDVVNRGVAAWKGKVYVGSFDGRLIALDAKTGKPAWTTDTVIDRNRSYTITGAPRVVKDKVIIGNGGAEMGVRGYVSAYDAASGKLLWRFFTVPGDPRQPPENKAMEMAQKTWAGDAYVQQGGGGTVWDSMAYDPELDLLYIGTGNGSMWNRKVRSPGGGDNLFLSSIIALKPDSGEYVWHYQTTPGDTWDYTATQHIILADLRIKGELRKVLMQAPKNAFFYVIDRKTGELISAEKFAPSNWASHVDMKTGRPVENPEADWTKEARLIFPSPFGAHNWQPMSFNPKTGLVYIPMQETLILLAPDNNAKYVRKGIFNVGLQPFDIPEDPKGMQQVADAHKGHLLAWDPVAQKAAWDQPHVTIWNGGTLSTAGNLVFQGSADGRAVAYAADTGKKLWEAPANTGVMAGPVTYTVDGEQYVTFMAGWGGAFALGGAMANVAKVRPEARVLTYKLGGKAKMPAPTRVLATLPKPPPVTATAEQLALGRALYNGYCSVCHGFNAISGGVLPDLRYLTPEKHQIFAGILAGAYARKGMPVFADLLPPDYQAVLQQYIIKRAHDLEQELAAQQKDAKK
ncbi:PQQ-dependent dehydrogenase, methanol/ethanol family [Solimonas sp. SE-A11]|uniref:PQQ-dependent dehydrogenase, methanol/ethanol family n=1 Tax=Solimonas sp. SE-A11 TaxID=3054954 RepID=UPI00259CE4FB|nr:PQQ-dependent dehydrogenase, methanol/ethanol family [Solimonas sp. SE-A11]MDM4769186.1 PQQ-dependent dehydrogenase, methanol/ethanol family [Solimonas sp. SE-A11]